MKNKSWKRECNRVKSMVVAWRSMFSERAHRKVQRWYDTRGRVVYVDLAVQR